MEIVELEVGRVLVAELRYRWLDGGPRIIVDQIGMKHPRTFLT